MERELGRGGMATVYVARDHKHGRAVAIKVLRPELATALGPDRFLREIEIAANLVHPHILPLHDSGEADGLLYYVMPYVDGESLRVRLERESQLSTEEALKIASQVLSALSHAHSRGIIHRDIKPENILLSGGEAVVADFGIARAIGVAGERLTQAGMSLGTPSYMSPEQIAGDEGLDARCDVYSVACLLHEMLAGAPPFTGAPESVIEQQLTADPPPLRGRRRTVTPEVEAAVLKAMEKTPADRFPTAAAFLEALGRGGAIAPPARTGRSRLLAAAVMGAAVVGAIFVGSRWFFPPALAAGRQLDLAVFPFRPTGGGAEEYSEAIADLLTTALDGTPGVAVADPWSLWRPLRPTRDALAESPDPAEARDLTTGAGAARFVLGSALRADQALNLTVRLYAADAVDPEHTFSASGPVDSLSALVERVAVELIARLSWDSAPPDLPRLERYTTTSAPALKAYLVAKERMRRGFVEEAEAAIDTAIALDSTFALALVDAISIKAWAAYTRGEFYYFRELANQAERFGGSLSERNRLRLEAAVATVRTNGTQAAEATGRILALDSTDFGAWNTLAYTHLAYGWQYGADERDALRAADRIRRLDSTYVPGAVFGAQLALSRNDTSAIADQMRRLRALDTTSVLVSGALLSLRGVSARDDEFQQLVGDIAGRPPSDWIAVVRALRMANPERAEMLLDRVRQTAGPGFPIWAAEGEQARLQIAEGRLRVVDSTIQAGGYRTFDLYRNIQRFLVAAAMTGVGDSTIAQRAVTSLAGYVTPDSALHYFNERPVWWTGWLVAAYHAMFGDTAVTRRWHEVIGTMPVGDTLQDYRGALQDDLDARLAVRRGDLDAALPLAERAYDRWVFHTENDWEALAAPAMRFHLALLYRSANQPERAEAMLRSLVPPGTWMGSLTARASYELGELAEARGAYLDAARYYQQAAALWERGGSESEAWLTRARTAVDRTLRQIG